MSDGEENSAPEVDGPVQDTTEVATGEMSVLVALQKVLKASNANGGVLRGIRQCTKALDRRAVRLAVLNDGCEEESLKKLVTALCAVHKIPLIKVPDGKQLGEWSGLCTEGPDGSVVKVVSTSVAVVLDWGNADSSHVDLLTKYFETED